MKLGYVIIYVNGVEDTIDFYQRAFGCTLKFMHDTGEYAELSTGETTLAFAAEVLPQMQGMEIIANRLHTKSAGAEDVQAAFDKAVKEGAIAMVKPVQKPWGQTVSYVRDNNGFLVEICSPIAS